MQLDAVDKKELLRTARNSIACALQGRRFERRENVSAALKEKCGAFVTLHLHGELRGCIGYIEARSPLIRTVEEVAQKAAFEDPRFLPLTAEEFSDVKIEVSVLSPLQKTSDPKTVEVGKHGLVIDAGYTRGLLLPQVAVEYGWRRDEFLSHTCRKAGLPADSWKTKDVTIYTFTSEVFSEDVPAAKRHA
jgi:AmmeMemoRadiSam system protein A